MMITRKKCTHNRGKMYSYPSLPSLSLPLSLLSRQLCKFLNLKYTEEYTLRGLTSSKNRGLSPLCRSSRVVRFPQVPFSRFCLSRRSYSRAGPRVGCARAGATQPTITALLKIHIVPYHRSRVPQWSAANRVPVEFIHTLSS